jgi:2-dehydropantoate 2-reductase
MTGEQRARRYAVIGTGAVGGFYGARLQQAGRSVHFLARSDREVIARQGLDVRSKDGDFSLFPVAVYGDVREMPRCDVVIVALKTTHNALLAELLPPVLADDGVVVMLQNGLGSEEAAAAVVGAERVVGGLSFVCAHKLGPGKVDHLDYGQVTLGAYAEGYAPQGVTAATAAVATDLRAAGIAVEVAADLLQARWRKLVWNIPFNGLSVILDERTNRMMADPAIRTLARALMEEVVQGAAASGRTIPETFIERMLEHTQNMIPYHTSMKLDYDAGRPLEIEAIYSRPLAMAAAAGVDLPRIAVLTRQLQFLDRRRRGL